jgi:glutamin-(asparagin-)ase
VRASRTGSGIVIRNAAQPDDRYGWIAADDQVPHKARILMMVALTGTRTTHALQEAFVTY